MDNTGIIISKNNLIFLENPQNTENGGLTPYLDISPIPIKGFIPAGLCPQIWLITRPVSIVISFSTQGQNLF